MSDPYSSIAAQPSEVTDKLAGVLEMRAAQTEQTHLRDHLLMQKLHGSVLEIGAGTGAITRAIAALPSVTEVTGLDPSAAFLDAARANAGPKEIYVEGYSTSLPVADASADAVVLWTTLSHIPVEQHAESYAEILRVLKPGGVLHVFDNDLGSWEGRLHERDPLDVPVRAFLDLNADPLALRKIPVALAASGFEVGPYTVHTVVDEAEDTYGYQFIMLRGIDMFADKGIVGQPMIEAMKAEAARRVAAGEFRMVLGYGYVAAQKPSG